MSNNPLVSVIVVTYNSAKYVLETLESIKKQTYKNIELIVTDDGSTDNTIEICKCWLEQNKHRFVRVELITSPTNTGIPANCNRGLKAAKGEWIKFISGDDLLEKDCIAILIKFSNIHDDCKILTGNAIKIDSNSQILNIMNNRKKIFYFKLWRVLAENGIIACTSFIKRKTLLDLGGFSEKYKVEDYYLWAKALSNKIKILYLPIILCYYRVHDNSISKNYFILLNDVLDILNDYKHNYFFFFTINLFHYKQILFHLKNRKLKEAFNVSKILIKKFPLSCLVYLNPKLIFYFIKVFLFRND